jgi:hypothetical protein
VSPKLKVNKINYINKKKLTVELAVAGDAEALEYDVRVTTLRGPKGIGTELFRVVEKDRPSDEFTVTDFTVEQVDRTETLEAEARCPDPTQPCNKLILQYTGDVDAVSFQVGIDWEGLYYDHSLEYAWRIPVPWLGYATGTLYPDGSNTITTYWQGQWRPTLNWECVYVDAGCDPIGETELVVDRGPVPYVFSISIRVGDKTSTGYRPRDKVARAYFRGPAPQQTAYPVLDDFDVVVTRGSKKNPQASALSFETQVFSDPVLQDGSTSLAAWTQLVVTTPDGHSFVPAPRSLGIDHETEPDVWKEKFFLNDAVEGCYSVRVLGVVTTTYEGHNADRLAAWDPTANPVEIGMDFDGLNLTVIEGGCGN